MKCHFFEIWYFWRVNTIPLILFYHWLLDNHIKEEKMCNKSRLFNSKKFYSKDIFLDELQFKESITKVSGNVNLVFEES